jgi:hypothetical protein
MVIGLSVSKKTVIETKINTDEELLKQAFNTAESGLDYYLKVGETSYTTDDGRAKAEISKENIAGTNTYEFEDLTLNSRKSIFWLVSHDVNGAIDETSVYDGSTVNVCLSKQDGSDFTSGAVMLDYYYRGADGNIKLTRSGYNLENSNVVENFTTLTESCVNNFPTGDTPLLLVITPIGDAAWITISSETNDFPIQGETITSTGKSGEINTAPISRKVKIMNRYKVPFFMLEAITAGGNITN